MQLFEIEFSANGIDYKARAHRIPADDTLPVEYHVSNIQPQIANAPRSFMFVYNLEEAHFDSTIFNDDYDLSANIFESIKKYCSERQIPLSS
ncbi:MAG: hypothetical protein ABI416_11005 [Ginsengibacter sp.]